MFSDFITEKIRKKNKDRSKNKEERNPFKISLPTQKTKHQKKSLLVPVKLSAALELSRREGEEDVEASRGSVVVLNGQSSAGRARCRFLYKAEAESVELGFAVLCWESLGNFPIAAFCSSGFYTFLSS